MYHILQRLPWCLFNSIFRSSAQANIFYSNMQIITVFWWKNPDVDGHSVELIRDAVIDKCSLFNKKCVIPLGIYGCRNAHMENMIS